MALSRSGAYSRALSLCFIALPIAPLLLGGGVNAAAGVTGTTIVAGLLWIGIAVLLRSQLAAHPRS
jgi:hypothetical protein